ncbi:MAG: hypothetical protein ISR84_02390 [Kiritimatiellales bacterium]|nr:hypothetical protein [Kiritimatiellales bacterium]
MKQKMNFMGRFAAVVVALVGTLSVSAADRFADYEERVKETHSASLALRESALRKVIAKAESWPYGVWGDTMWALSALYLNEKTDDANDRLLEYAQSYCKANDPRSGEEFRPENSKDATPWGYFGLTDYVRILSLFNAESPHFPGRLRPETEAAMKEALWLLVKADSKVVDASLDNLMVLLGTENHDLTLRPNYYLVAAMLKDDPAFKDRKYDDGHTAAEHYAAYNRFFQEWPRRRAMSGLWFEVGSDNYQKYSWPSLFNLHELSPDPLVRKRFGMLMDVAFIEEAQVSVKGRRGGGRSRAEYGKNNFEHYKNLLYAPAGAPAGCSHSKVIETSRYQLPAAAVLLRKMAFPAEKPFLITNRVLGELATETPTGGNGSAHTADSALVNYAYRTPHYILGSTLQNPALSMPSPDTGEPVLKYTGISHQTRWCGILFDDPGARPPAIPVSHHRADDEMCAIFPVIDKTRGGRPQHPLWSFQHENVLLIQRIDDDKKMGSYSTGRMSIRFHGKGLEKVEKDGWIFAGNGKGFAAVKFLDGGYEWDKTGELASPVTGADIPSTTRVIMQTGDLDACASFEAFRADVLANPLTVKRNWVTYQSAANASRLEWFRYDVKDHESFRLPKVDGKTINIRPESTYRSPYLNGKFGDDVVTVTVGPVQQVYDFGSQK